jgi:hypothetical protein
MIFMCIFLSASLDYQERRAGGQEPALDRRAFLNLGKNPVCARMYFPSALALAAAVFTLFK